MARGGGGRKKMKQEALKAELAEHLEAGQSIVRVVSLRGSNLIEVEDANTVRTLCLLPAKFNKSLWIKRGSFVVVNEGEREKALEAGSKVTGIISQVLFEEQIRALKRTSAWPAAFSDSVVQPSENARRHTKTKESVEDGSDNNSSDDDLPPLEANQNRCPMETYMAESSEEDED